jgi:hypothetical protein
MEQASVMTNLHLCNFVFSQPQLLQSLEIIQILNILLNHHQLVPSNNKKASRLSYPNPIGAQLQIPQMH